MFARARIERHEFYPDYYCQPTFKTPSTCHPDPLLRHLPSHLEAKLIWSVYRLCQQREICERCAQTASLVFNSLLVVRQKPSVANCFIFKNISTQ